MFIIARILLNHDLIEATGIVWGLWFLNIVTACLFTKFTLNIAFPQKRSWSSGWFERFPRLRLHRGGPQFQRSQRVVAFHPAARPGKEPYPSFPIRQSSHIEWKPLPIVGFSLYPSLYVMYARLLMLIQWSWCSNGLAPNLAEALFFALSLSHYYELWLIIRHIKPYYGVYC